MKNPRKRLTEEVIKAAPYPDYGQNLVRDSIDIGLVLRLTAGSKAFCFEGAARHRMHRVKLGTWPDMSLAMARRKARWYRTEISEGRDPFTEREQRLRADKDAVTFDEMAARYIAEYAKPRLRSWWRMERRLKQHFNRWNSRRLGDITPGNASAAHSRIAAEHGQVEANRALALVRAVFNKAHKWNLFTGTNPVSGVEFFPEDPDTRALHPDEFERVITEIAAEKDWRWRAYFRILSILPLRRSEFAAARWENVDLVHGELKLPKLETKTGRSRIVPLPSDVADIMGGLPSRGESDFVFPGKGRTGHVVEPTAAWDRIRRRAGVEHITIHDIRRSVGTMMDQNRVSLSVIQKLLGHQRLATTERYLKPHLDDQRRAVEQQAAMVAGG